MNVVPEGGSLLYHDLTMITDGHTTIEHSLPVANIYQDVIGLWSQTKVALHADAHRRLRRVVGRVLLVRARQRVGARRGCSRSRRATSSMRARAGGSRRPATTTSITSASRGTSKRLADAGVVDQHGRARPAAGTRRALGDLDAGAGRHDADGRARDRDDQCRPIPRPRPRARVARARQARRPRRPRPQPAREHPQHRLGVDGDGERPPLRRGDA